jgi:hypothetical protein
LKSTHTHTPQTEAAVSKINKLPVISQHHPFVIDPLNAFAYPSCFSEEIRQKE